MKKNKQCPLRPQQYEISMELLCQRAARQRSFVPEVRRMMRTSKLVFVLVLKSKGLYCWATVVLVQISEKQHHHILKMLKCIFGFIPTLSLMVIQKPIIARFITYFCYQMLSSFNFEELTTYANNRIAVITKMMVKLRMKIVEFVLFERTLERIKELHL